MRRLRGLFMAALGMGLAVSEGTGLKIDMDQIVHETNHKKLVSSNIALWNQLWELGDKDLRNHVRKLEPSFIRMPGGSWANHYMWNGNGARLGADEYDFSKLKNNYWEIDYSDYAPGFSIHGDARQPVGKDDHGNWHVKQLHDFVESFGAEGIVTVNVGTGTPEMAAEWVRWANKKNKYNVRYWEIGNELEGEWELGHVLPDGSKMTGEKFAKRYVEFAKAMKAVDPSIKTGGPASSNQRCAFIEEVLRDGGDYVDFVSFHTYPVENQPQQDSDFYAKIFELEDTTKMIRGWIEKYQPTRKDKIEIAITEWNSKVVEDRMTADLMNGLWHTIWVGEMFRNGISFANHWDMMTATATGGHGLFYFDQFDFVQPGVPQEEMDRQYLSFNPPCIPKGQYWALYLWSRYMGDQLVSSKLDVDQDLYAAVTRSVNKTAQILLVNTSRDEVRTVQLDSTEPLADEGVAIQLSHREYFWNPLTRKPEWSQAPEPVKIKLENNSVTVPPFSALVVQVPFKGVSRRAVSRPQKACKAKHEISLLLPEATPQDVPVEAWVLMPQCGSYEPNEAPMEAAISIKGPGKSDLQKVRINEGAGRFYIQPTGTGDIEVTARFGEASTKTVLKAKPVERRNETLWRFEGEDGLAGTRSDFALSLSDTAKPNQQTAMITLKGDQPTAGKDGLILFEGFPQELPKERIGGIFLEMFASHDLATDDPYARLEVILQSESNHWMPIGAIEFKDLKGGWKTIERAIENPALYETMKWLYAIRIQLVSRKPVTGTIYVNDAGVILR